MRWECSECGSAVDAEMRPRYCAGCGTAGVIFVEAPPGIEGDATSETVFESWLHFGLDEALVLPHRSRAHPVRHHGHL